MSKFHLQILKRTLNEIVRNVHPDLLAHHADSNYRKRNSESLQHLNCVISLLSSPPEKLDRFRHVRSLVYKPPLLLRFYRASEKTAGLDEISCTLMIYPDAELVRQLFKDSPTRNESDKLDPLPHPSHQRPQFSGLNRFGERIRRPLSDSQRTDELYQHVTSIPPSREPQQSQYRQRLFQVVPDRFPADLAEDLRCLTVGKLAVPTNQSTSQLLQQVKTGAVNTSEIERSLHSLIIGTFSIEIARLHEKVNSGGSQLREELRELGESEGRRMLKELFRSVGYRAAGTGKQQTPKVQQTAKPFGRDFADAFRAQCAKS